MKIHPSAYLWRALHFALRLSLVALLLLHFAARAQQGRIKTSAPELRNDHLAVFPNPSPGKFTVSVNDIERVFDINIYNVVGEMVYHWEVTQPGAASVEINMSRQPRGVYFVELDTDDGNLVKKVVLDPDKSN